MAKRKFREGFIIAAVILALVQTFMDEYARYAHWSVSARNILLCAGLFFDVIFSVEFAVRSILSGRKGLFLSYIKYGRGWVDFLTSFPLLILYSGPSLFLLLHGEVQAGTAAYAIPGVLNVVNTTRAAGMLRAARAVKIPGKTGNAGSLMAGHHTASAAATAVFTVVAVLMAWSAVAGFAVQGNAEKRRGEYSRMLEELMSISELNDISFRDACENFLIRDPAVLKIEYGREYSYEKLSSTEFRKYYDAGDFVTVKVNECSLAVSIVDLERGVAMRQMQNLLIVVSLVLSFMLFYSRHFAVTVSDVAHILNSGFRRKDYNLMVKIRDEYRGEELYRLAQFYNDAYLPAKLRKIEGKEKETGSPITMDDMMNFGR